MADPTRSSTEYSIPFPGHVEEIDTTDAPAAPPVVDLADCWDDEDGLDYTYWP